ncbi:MAG: DUF6134 family protein [Xanthomonadales bacterium]|nr:DUF6134 family protein [Xanthomonadales bacterium]
MDVRKVAFLVLCSLMLIAPAWSKEPSSNSEQVWRFQVYVDDKDIGFHEFRVRQQGDQQVLSSVAEFEYKLMFVTLYRYQHRNEEVWQDGCLTRIESSTDANGKVYAVAGEQNADGFKVDGSKGSAILPDCVMSFAYWNQEFLQATQLLNTQDGEYMDVAVTEPVNELLMFQGQPVATQRYQLSAKKLNLELWYSEQGEWLALRSQYDNGRTLRYELLTQPTNLNKRLAGL